MTNVSDLFPAGGGNNTIEMVASGALSNGDKVILQSDGTVKVVASTAVSESIPAGAESVFNSGGNIQFTSCSFDPNTAGKFVVAYTDYGNNTKGTAVVGTISGTTITFGAEYVFSSGVAYYTSCSFDPNTSGKFVVAYKDGNSTYGTAVVGTVSGTTLSFGTAVVFNSGNTLYSTLSFDPNTSGKFVVAYRDAGNSSYGTAIVGTVSGTTLSFGAEYVFNSTDTHNPFLSFDPNTAGKFVVSYKDQGGFQYGTAVVGTVSGTTITFGAKYVFNSANTTQNSSAFDPNTAGKFVIAYYDGGNAGYGTAIVGTISGTTITYGSAYLFNSANTQNTSVSFDPNTVNKFVITYRDDGNSNYGTTIVGTVSGTTLSFGSAYVFNSAATRYTSVSFDPNTAGKFVVAYLGVAVTAAAVVGTITSIVTNLTSTNFLGIAQATVADTATVEVETLGGLATNLSGLTIGSKYYVQDDGTTTTNSAGQFLGRAVTATTINMKDFT